MQHGLVGRASVALFALAISGCSAQVDPVPAAPAPTVTLTHDERCEASFPEFIFEEHGSEDDLAARPDGWPAAPTYASLCWSVLGAEEETAHYAVDPGTDPYLIDNYYRAALDELGGRLEHSPAAYQITWAR